MSHESASKEPSDEDLFEKFRRGSSHDFDTLLSRYQQPILGYILRHFSDRSVADDVFQDVFFKVIEKRDRFQTGTSFKAWVYTVCRNTCIDEARRRSRMRETASIPLEETSSAANDCPLQAAESNATRDFLHQALKDLPEEQKETFSLRVLEELTFEEISSIMKCSLNTTKSRMRYAVQTLREIFTKRGYFAT